MYIFFMIHRILLLSNKVLQYTVTSVKMLYNLLYKGKNSEDCLGKYHKFICRLNLPFDISAPYVIFGDFNFRLDGYRLLQVYFVFYIFWFFYSFIHLGHYQKPKWFNRSS